MPTTLPLDVFLSAFRLSPMAMTLHDACDSEFSVIYANPAFEQLTGYSRTEVIGRSWRFLEGPDTDPLALALIRAALIQGTAVTLDVASYRKDGTPFTNTLFYSPIRDEVSQEVLYYFSSQFDNTRWTAAEAELRRLKYEMAIDRPSPPATPAPWVIPPRPDEA